jgi:hypothetical protein
MASFQQELKEAQEHLEREIENASMPGINPQNLREAIEELIDLRVYSIVANSSWAGANLLEIGKVAV